jgi:hypothetical protein
MAMALYAKQANNHEAELQTIQIRVRAARRAGELSKKIEKGIRRRSQEQKSNSAQYGF